MIWGCTTSKSFRVEDLPPPHILFWPTLYAVRANIPLLWLHTGTCRLRGEGEYGEYGDDAFRVDYSAYSTAEPGSLEQPWDPSGQACEAWDAFAVAGSGGSGGGGATMWPAATSLRGWVKPGWAASPKGR